MKTYRHAVFWALLMLVVLALPASSAHGAEMLAVARDGVILRDAPNMKAKVLWKYDKGLPLEITGAKDDWRKVSDFEGDGGWLRVADLNKEPHMVVRVNKDTGEKVKVNIRKGPGEEYQIIGQEEVNRAVFSTLGQNPDWVGPDQKLGLVVLEEKLGWVKVRYDSGLEGWIKPPTNAVNIRKGPGEEYELVGQAVYGAVFSTLEQKLGWVKVRHVEPGVVVEGWIKRNLLWGF